MSERVTLVMEPRTKTGKGENGRLRRTGYTPCIFYGPEMEESIMGKVKTKDIERIMATGRMESTRIIMTLPNGEEELCIVREAQVNPLNDQPLHIDFLRLIKGRPISVRIPIVVHGRETAPGIKEGGVMEALHDIELESLPMSIPDVIEVDASQLNLGDAIHAGDLQLPEGVSLLVDPEEIVAVIVVPRGIEEPEEEAEEEVEAAEVEVVGKGKAAKEDEEGEDAGE